MESNAPQSYLIEFAPVSLYKMLVREAAFALTRRRLNEAITLAEHREKEIKATRPPFMVLLPGKARREIVSNLAESKNTRGVLKSGLDKLDQLEPELMGHVALRLENHLRRSSADYVAGLAANRYPHDWERLKARFAQCAHDYHETLTQLFEVCAIMVSFETIGTQPASRKLLSEAVALGVRLEAEVLFINKIAHAQRMRAGPGGFTLKLQSGVNWQEAAQALLGLNAKTGAVVIRDLIGQSERATQAILAEISEEVALTLAQKSHDIASYHAGQWNSLREAALLKIDPGDLEALVKETETLLETGEFKAWSLLDEAPPAIPAPAPSSGPLPRPSAADAPAPVPVPVPKPVPPQERGQPLRLPSRALTRPPFAAPSPADRPLTTSPFGGAMLGGSSSATTPSRLPASPEHAPAPAFVPAPAPAPAPTQVPAPSASQEEINALLIAKAEIERQTRLLEALKTELEARESFINESENRLIEKTSAQQEQEAELEQRSEELQHLEKRLRQLQADADPDAPPKASAAPRMFNEFLE